MSKQEEIREIKYKCGHCEYEGYCYGIPHNTGVSAPFCYRCGMNNKLEPLIKEGNE